MTRKAVVLAFITITIWGSSFAAIRASLLGGYEAGHLMLVRYLIASSLFLFYFLWARRTFQYKRTLHTRQTFGLPAKKDVLRIMILGWIGISVYHFGVTVGMQTVPAGTAGMIIGTAPIFTAIIALFVLKERLSATGWIGLGIGFTGMVIINWGSSGEDGSFSLGALFVFISALATSIFFVFQKPLLKRYQPIELTAYFTWAGTIPFFLFAPGVFTSIQNATLEAHLAALYVGIFPAAIAYVTWATALSNGRASSVTSMMYLEPVIAIIVAWLWLSELPTIISIIGGVIALSGVILVNQLGKRNAKKGDSKMTI